MNSRLALVLHAKYRKDNIGQMLGKDVATSTMSTSCCDSSCVRCSGVFLCWAGLAAKQDPPPLLIAAIAIDDACLLPYKCICLDVHCILRFCSCPLPVPTGPVKRKRKTKAGRIPAVDQTPALAGSPPQPLSTDSGAQGTSRQVCY